MTDVILMLLVAVAVLYLLSHSQAGTWLYAAARVNGFPALGGAA